MSTSEMERLGADYGSDPALRDKLDGAAGLAEGVTLARDAGYDVEEAEVGAYLAAMREDSDAELSDSQLDAVSGGKNDPLKGGPTVGDVLGAMGVPKPRI